MVDPNSAEIAARIRTMRNHGQAGKYLSSEPGWNSRLDEIQAAILRVKLRHLSNWQRARQSHAAERSEERRVGKECRSRRWQRDDKKKRQRSVECTIRWDK